MRRASKGLASQGLDAGPHAIAWHLKTGQVPEVTAPGPGVAGRVLGSAVGGGVAARLDAVDCLLAPGADGRDLLQC